jgi:phage-related protein
MVSHWKTVGPFFSNLWKKVKEYFFAAVKWIWKYVIPFFMPWVLIIQHWDKIGPYFHELWEKVKKIFWKMVDWFKGMGKMFWDAGKNIIKNIWEGMKSLIHKPVEAIKEMAHKIRQYLPFSPAKEGPLKDIHRIRLIETIAESVNPKAMLQKMQGVATAIFNFKPAGGGNGIANATMAMAGGGSLNGANLNFNFNYYANDKKNWVDEKSQFMKDIKANAKQIAGVIQKEIENAARKKY